MENLYKLLTVCGLFLVNSPVLGAPSNDDFKLTSILEQRQINCNDFEPNLSPSLNFETLEPIAKFNETKNQVSLYIPIVYYRCELGLLQEGELKIVDPSKPYQYDVEQLDGTKITVQVDKQGYSFRAQLDDGSKGLPARVNRSGLVENIQFDIPLEKLLSRSQRQNLKNGSKILTKVKVIASLAMDYQIGDSTKDSTGLVPKFVATWTVKFTKEHGQLKVFLQQASLSRLN